MKRKEQRHIEIWAHWVGIDKPTFMGTLYAAHVRGKEIYSFEYDKNWLKLPFAQVMDPSLGLYEGTQYPKDQKANFGIFLDSSPDRWGRLLMLRREVWQARKEERPVRHLLESNYLLGVDDAQRMGGLRFKLDANGPFLDNKNILPCPPLVNLREIEAASFELERGDAEDDPQYEKWLKLLIAPGSSLGGARPKSNVLDGDKNLWIAKFPSLYDKCDIGAWESIAMEMARVSLILCKSVVV